MRRATAALLALVLATALAACGSTAPKPESTRLPSATLQPLGPGGQAVRTGDLRGPMVINLWAQWCGPCKDELPKYEAFHRAHPQLPVLGVDWFDPQPARARALAEKVGLTYPLVTDPDRHLGGPRPALPQLFLIDAKGRIAYSAYVEIKSVSQLEDLVRTHLEVDL
ncbi:hypothetical protein GCM10011519_24200 [Marmoricola endophyticus]|uniref:Thioredoxin domain-containing protein n=1 Tax=Marmoricola endophyticus TaxID=2040280 RepID=A0A917BMA4_9ACTN|nr:TlpA disulfide reductase family protein [Marmoricola endophyticus]GGF49409.1 hypothetical protein GCM10011519_24200 [Marmoricola endophyticus]